MTSDRKYRRWFVDLADARRELFLGDRGAIARGIELLHRARHPIGGLDHARALHRIEPGQADRRELAERLALRCEEPAQLDRAAAVIREPRPQVGAVLAIEHLRPRSRRSRRRARRPA